jgi:hypothetical protein
LPKDYSSWRKEIHGGNARQSALSLFDEKAKSGVRAR